MPTEERPDFTVELIGHRYQMPVEQAAEMFGWPVDIMRARFGDSVPVVQNLKGLTIEPPAADSPKED